jgi:hypothetical protein
MADIGWRRRRGSSSAARRGARQRAGLTLAFASNTLHASGRRFIHNSSGQSKNPIDSDHGIYRYNDASSSHCRRSKRPFNLCPFHGHNLHFPILRKFRGDVGVTVFESGKRRPCG